MAVSMVFSLVLFSISRGQLEASLRKQYTRTRVDQRLNMAPNGPIDISSELTEGSARLVYYLFEFNLVILALSVLASYKLARQTLGPIEEAHNAQARFTADASHELRTPLTAMRTEIEVALRDKKLSSSDARELLASNLEEINKLELLSNALLKLAQTGQDGVPMKQTNIKHLVESAIDRVRKPADLRAVTIKAEVKDAKLCGDEASLTELFVILLDNAIKYSSSKTEVLVTMKKVGNELCVAISDHGQGISAQDMPRIFDRFYRADNSRSRQKVEGYGLGLSIAKKIVELHNGSIEVTSTLGQGSVFTVKLPLNQKV